MSRAQRRYDAETVFARRKKQWIATSTARYGLGKLHFLKRTARPCSCNMCKRQRYEREPMNVVLDNYNRTQLPRTLPR